jgi:hypothetical protein
MRLGGLSHLGRMHLGGGHIRRLSPAADGTRLGGLSSGRLSRGPGRGLRTGCAGRELRTGRSFANLRGLSRGRRMVATRVAPGFSRRTFARAAFGRGRSGSFDHDRFGSFHRFGVFGWAGPTFWPYAYRYLSRYLLGAIVAPDDFYGDLNDEQKAQFDRIGQSQTAERQPQRRALSSRSIWPAERRGAPAAGETGRW